MNNFSQHFVSAQHIGPIAQHLRNWRVSTAFHDTPIQQSELCRLVNERRSPDAPRVTPGDIETIESGLRTYTLATLHTVLSALPLPAAGDMPEGYDRATASVLSDYRRRIEAIYAGTLASYAQGFSYPTEKIALRQYPAAPALHGRHRQQPQKNSPLEALHAKSDLSPLEIYARTGLLPARQRQLMASNPEQGGNDYRTLLETLQQACAATSGTGRER